MGIESMEHLGYLFAAYSLIFAVIFLCVMFIWRRHATLDAELRALEARIAALTQATSASKAPQPPSDT